MLSHSELVEAIRGFALLYLEIEAARRPARTLTPYAAAGLVPQLHSAAREPVAGSLAVRGVDYTLIGDHAIRAVVVVYRGEKAGALGLTFRREDGRLRLVAVEAPDRALLAGD
jgi:hypothetical protein